MKKLVLFALMFVAGFTYAQTGSVSGKIVDPSDNEPLIGANVVLKGTTTGSTTNVDGTFSISGVKTGKTTIVISYVGYDNIEMNVTIVDGRNTEVGTIEMAGIAIGLKEIEVIASIAIDRKTPVAVSTVKGYQIEEKVGNQEFPEMLRYTPSVYVTKQGGGVGDSRINIRGFDQRNTAVLINGVPVNDMENGWVYWSNWQGLSDVTSNMQVQRGLSASKLAISSVGGTINIITNAAEMEKGGKFNVDIGNNSYSKYGLVLSTGLGKNGLAFTIQGTYSSGNGYVDGTSFKAGSYFASLAWKINSSHSIHITALGAPQWHNQRTLGSFDGVTIQTYKDHPRGIKYNHLWGDYKGKEFSWRKNFYHKPITYLNWYWTIGNRTELATTAYGSWGRGGGTGPRGRINGSFETSSKFKDGRYSGTDPAGNPYQGQVDFENIALWNSGVDVPAYGAPKEPWLTNGQNPGVDNRRGFFDDKYVNTSRDGFVRRASMNAHNWYGILSTLNHEFSDTWTFVGGIDIRGYRGIHYRRLDNLLGSDAYFTRRNINIAGEFITQEKESTGLVSLRDDRKLAYHNDGIVGWYGLFGQLEYSKDKLSAHLSTAISNQSYQRVDFFNYYYSDDLNGSLNPGGENMVSELVTQLGGNLKVGLNYNLNDNHNVFFNGGYFSRQPLFDAVFLNFVNVVNPDIKNEKITGLEFGYGYRSSFLNANVNIYNTTWTDRFLQRSIQLGSGQSGTANLNGIKQVHSGLEIEIYGEIARGLTLEAMFSAGNWTYGDNVDVSVFDDNQDIVGDTTFYMKNAKVGDAAQLTTRIGLTYEIISGLRIYGSWYLADNLYSDYDITRDKNFLDPNLPAEDKVLKLPGYTLVDVGVYYGFKVGGTDWMWKLNINNLLDTMYWSEGETNITAPDRFNENIAYPGFGLTWNTGLSIRI